MASAPSPEPQHELPFTFGQRLKLSLVTAAGYLAIALIGPTLRPAVSIEDGGPANPFLVPAIYALWHRCVFFAAFFWRRRGIAVLTSRSFDGEYIARIIEKFGFRAVRGSSSRGGARALLEMHDRLAAGGVAGFTIDGPRGPRYVAKPGAALLARNSGCPIMAFHIAFDRCWILRSWDAFLIPKPFARAFIRIGRLVRVPADADDATLARCHLELQATLVRVRDYAEASVSLPPQSAS
jgi:lysophospholipid acyltransferase (LPLAT)-like uncharacterized protein